ncbi:MAG: BcpO-related WXXGXW repeat protein [Chlorobiaceae bacterium]|jgi:hypothetical protein|nr:BcpO-related WXXGXW repeat protein [Chlorobiaceae bacterium]NTV15845.1 BcpO-related WXXGXW repeat protein [Chlorobiaceae bacterium]
MKKQIWIAAGIAGMLLGSPAAQAEVNVRVGIGGDRPPSFVFDSRPDFINVPNLGFYVSSGGPQDIVRYNSRYYVFHNGRWFISSNYRGPWVVVREGRLPRQIRRHRWEDIRRYRDVEYRRHESRYNRDDRFRDNRDDRFRDNRDPRDRNFNPDDRRPDDRGNNPGPDNRPNDGGRRN